MLKRSLLCFFLFCTSHVLGQTFIMTDAAGKLSRIRLNGTNITQQTIENECSRGVGSIAIYKNTIYYYDGSGIRSATIAGNKLINCKSVGRYNIGNNALTVDKNGILYGAIKNQLYKIDPVSGTLTNIGTMPYESGGDLIFYKDELYLASGDGIVKLNLANLAQSVVVIPDASGFGLAAIPYSSSENKIYTFDSGGTITEIDLENNRVLRRISDTNLFIYDAASIVEDGSVAKIRVDSVRKYADCPFTGKGTIEIICYDALADCTYELNGVTNTTGVFTGLSPGSFNIKVKTNQEVKDTVITVPRFLLEKPLIDVSTVDKLCEEPGQITLSSSNANNLLYTIRFKSNSYGINHTHTNLKAGTHRFIVVNNAGCAVDTIDVVLNICKIQSDGFTVQQDCNSIFRGNIRVKTKPHRDIYTFKMGSATNQTGIFDGLEKGTYKVTITSPDDLQEVDVTVPDYAALAPTITYKATNAICETTGSVKFNIVGDATGYTIKLDGKVYTFSHEFKLYGGTHIFTVVKPNGCLLNIYPVTLDTEGCDDLYFPNTFTPNDDGINDVFLPGKEGKAVDFDWKIYNRHGTSVFNSKSTHNGWNGEYNGKPVGTGVYYWVATYLNKEGKFVTKSGSVTLLR